MMRMMMKKSGKCLCFNVILLMSLGLCSSSLSEEGIEEELKLIKIPDGCIKKTELINGNRHRFWSQNSLGTANGPYIEWIVEGKIQEKCVTGFMKDGKKEGRWWEKKAKEGKVEEVTSHYTNGVLNGWFEILDVSGNLTRSGFYVKGKPIGIWTTRDLKFKNILKVELVEDGGDKQTSIEVDEKGKIKSINGSHGNGHIRLIFHPNGLIKQAGIYSKTKGKNPWARSGPVITFYENGRISSVDLHGKEGRNASVYFSSSGGFKRLDFLSNALGRVTRSWTDEEKIEIDTKVNWNGDEKNPYLTFQYFNGNSLTEEIKYSKRHVFKRFFYRKKVDDEKLLMVEECFENTPAKKKLSYKIYNEDGSIFYEMKCEK